MIYTVAYIRLVRQEQNKKGKFKTQENPLIKPATFMFYDITVKEPKRIGTHNYITKIQGT